MIQIPVEPKATEYLHQLASRKKVPLNGTFELTPVCNMACRMCYVRMTKQQQEAVAPLRTAQEWVELGRVARDRGMLYLLLTGGEPFSRPDFREILSGLHRLGLLISVNTNGTLIDEETVAWLKETPPVRFNITLYGASNETYARLCGNPQGFTQVTRAIRLLREAGMLVKLNCSLTPYNKDDLEEMIAFAQQEKLVIQATSYMFPPCRRDPSMVGVNDRFTPEEAAYYAAKITSLLNGEEEFAQRVRENNLPGLITGTEDDCTYDEGEGIRCRAGKCSFWITWEGTLMPCGMMVVGGEKNVFEDGFDAAWTAAVAAAEAVRLSPQCRGCGMRDQCQACAAMALTETGSFLQVPEYRCQMTKAYPEVCRQLEQEIEMRLVEKGKEE